MVRTVDKPNNEPNGSRRSLSDHEVYALVAYPLAENKLIHPNEVIDAATLPQVRMPNRDNFVVQLPDRM
ncbi:MAG TPA: hypothetical protein VKX28_27510 [Xanthobacteraceae bacterium]|nr:hypothetical protein [Xanthobacteraceae bacterium]